jgi:hypothetical protein
MLGAVIVLADAPGDAVRSFLYGQGTITETIAAPPGLGYSSIAVNLPANGLLAPLEHLSQVPTPGVATA